MEPAGIAGIAVAAVLGSFLRGYALHRRWAAALPFLIPGSGLFMGAVGAIGGEEDCYDACGYEIALFVGAAGLAPAGLLAVVVGLGVALRNRRLRSRAS